MHIIHIDRGGQGTLGHSEEAPVFFHHKLALGKSAAGFSFGGGAEVSGPRLAGAYIHNAATPLD